MSTCPSQTTPIVNHTSPASISHDASNKLMPMVPSQQQLNAFSTSHFVHTESIFNIDMLPKQVGSPLDLFKIAKNEPSSSSNSQPGTPVQMDRRAVPACAICGTDSTGIHFGVDACAACSAFFRRTVVLDKRYVCNKGGNCVILKDSSSGQKCRACRFKKCLNAGMDRGSVQHRRDAIGKYSAGVKREHSPDIEFDAPKYNNIPSTSSNGYAVKSPEYPIRPQVIHQCHASTSRQCFSPQQPKSILHELIIRQNFVLEQRQIFYADRNLFDWFRKPLPLSKQPIHELTNFSNCMYHLWKVEPRLAADFINRNRYMDAIVEEDKVKIFRNFVVIRQAVEEPYITWIHGGLDKNWFVMPNMTYIDFNNAQKYLTNGALEGLNLDLETAKNLFVPSFLKAMDSVGNLMKNIEISETEFVILLGLVLFDPSIGGIQENTRQILSGIRDQLIQDVFIYYEDEENRNEPEIRIADLFMILSAIKVHAIKTSENMQLLRIFDLIPSDPCFNQMMESERPTNDFFTEMCMAAQMNGNAMTTSTSGVSVGEASIQISNNSIPTSTFPPEYAPTATVEIVATSGELNGS
ncbi:unnamed protein product [Caenorhabditis bovis]|uniref:Uncharacterized protein n=1 Tax=Caenorhabditis bovis TaxID=2654633 RepID=A0A8S1F159_9PELO|nr:unnamed protein product [Caenorhabditis bovis]